jgi:D-amino-acid dehydrogenase
MRVVVLGAGVIGVTSAYHLAKAGHEVVVLDRRPGPAEETSRANAGLIAPGHATAWASPRAPLQFVQSLLGRETALKFHFRIDPRFWAWSLRFLAQCTAGRNRANTATKFALCRYSRQALDDLARETAIDFHRVTKGALYIYRDADHLATGVNNMKFLNDQGAGLEAVTPGRCLELEPALAGAKVPLAGAIYAAKDESGDCHGFTVKLAERCQALGAKFRHGITIRGLDIDGDTVRAVTTDQGDIAGDLFVLSLASDSPSMVRSHGVRLPIYPIKGYSLTLPARAQGAPTMGGVDEALLVAFSRMGDRLRLTATADFAGYDTDFSERDFTIMLRVARDLFPDGADYDRRDYWSCLRPTTPDGPPVVGRGRHRNLYFNTGHGHMGWTMACGSARILADLIAERRPDIDPSGLDPARYN